jgi:DNA modification methylase
MKCEIKLGKYDGTFQKSKTLPIHRWYPFIEGFGEQLVWEIVREFADKSTYLVDPFAGCGTTLLVASKYGLKSGYCEINPFLKFVIDTKINSPVRLQQKEIDVPTVFRDFLSELSLLNIKTFPPAHVSCNPKFEQYFDENILDVLLRLKQCTLDYFNRDNDLKSIALLMLSSLLIETSHLKRAGDVRYRRNNEKVKLTESDVVFKFREKIEMVIEDFRQPMLPKVPTDFLGENALTGMPDNQFADLIVTSPPYLNGTNYIRNTKVEMWFLGFINNEEELYQLHHRGVPSGINHVSRGKIVDNNLPLPIMDVVNKLKEVAYDSRIPLMVHQYFSDMNNFLKNAATYTLPSGSMFIDIGDSVFCGIHIPTHEFIKLLAEKAGFKFELVRVVRSRRSRGGGSVGQYLFQFKRSNAGEMTILPKLFPIAEDKICKETTDLENLIKDFQNTLPYKTRPYNKRNWGHRYHSLCSYQSKLKPSIAHFLIKWFTKPSDLILDPFGGVGTISLEAKLLGRPNIMIELSPMAYIVAKGKIEPVKLAEIKESYNSLIKFIEEHKEGEYIIKDLTTYSNFGFNKKLKDYYHIETFKEILSARRWLKIRTDENIARITPSDAFVIGCLLHLLHGNRPYSLSRRSHPITPFAPTGPFEYRSIRERLWDKIKRMYDEVVSTMDISSKVIYGDSLKLSKLMTAKVDTIITSPPFIHSTRFHTNNWIRNWFCGWEPEDFEEQKKNFIEVLQEKSLDIYTQLLEDWEKVLKPSGTIIFHLGTTKDCDMVEDVSKRIPNTFTILGKGYEFVRDTESHGVTAQGRIIKHGFLFLKKGG